MLSINMDDVIKVLNSIKSQLIGFGVVAVLLIAVMIACRKQSKSKKYLIRWQAGLGMVLALAITVNLILTGPMYSMVTLATGGGKVSEENVASATQLCENIADEGIVLLDNDGTLPMAPNNENPNLFSIGEGFGFFVFFGNENFGSFPMAVCPKPYQKKDRITKVTTVKVP